MCEYSDAPKVKRMLRRSERAEITLCDNRAVLDRDYEFERGYLGNMIFAENIRVRVGGSVTLFTVTLRNSAVVQKIAIIILFQELALIIKL